MNTQTNIIMMEKEALSPRFGFLDVDSIIHDSATFGRAAKTAKFFYSGAQHACIASYLAEDIYGIEAARAVLVFFCSDVHADRVGKELMRKFPCLKVHQDASRMPVFETFGIEMSIMKTRSVRHILKIMEAIESRDVTQVPHADVRVSAPSDVEVAPMTARQARTALTLRISELFDIRKIGLDADKSLRESTLSNIFAF